MRIIPSAIAMFIFAASAAPSPGATTADDAAKLQKSLQAYLGTAANAVKITPDGDGFKAVLDFASLFAMSNKTGAELTLPPFDFNLTPEGNGKWKIARQGPFKLASKLEGQFDITEDIESYNIDGEFDEALGALSTFSAEAKNITFNETLTDTKGTNIRADGKFDLISVKGTAVVNPAGGIDIKFSEPIGPAALNETIGAKDEMPLALQFKIAGGNFDGVMTGTKSLAILELLKFVVARPDQTALAKDQKDFKSLLTNLLPAFANTNGQGSLNKLEVQTPMGPASAEKVNFGLDLNGAVKDGKFAESFGVEGLALPPGLAPAWATSLLPKNTSFGFTVSGYDAEAVAMANIVALDLSKDPPLPKTLEDQMLALLLPKGTAEISFSKTGISNDTYFLNAEGSFAAGPAAVPSGKAHVTAKGLDDVLKTIQASPPEAGLQEDAAVIIVAKGIGKAEPDGSLSWDVQATPDGKILVNGTDMSKLGKQ
jgi:hypothetical protein